MSFLVVVRLADKLAKFSVPSTVSTHVRLDAGGQHVVAAGGEAVTVGAHLPRVAGVAPPTVTHFKRGVLEKKQPLSG